MAVRLAVLNVLHAVVSDYLFIYLADYCHPVNGDAGSINVVMEASACVTAV